MEKSREGSFQNNMFFALTAFFKHRGTENTERGTEVFKFSSVLSVSSVPLCFKK